MTTENKKGLTEKDDGFWGLLGEARRLYLEDWFFGRDAIICKFCWKEIKPKRRINNCRQHSFLLIAMEGHLKGHIRRGEITWDIIKKAKQKVEAI